MSGSWKYFEGRVAYLLQGVRAKRLLEGDIEDFGLNNGKDGVVHSRDGEQIWERRSGTRFWIVKFVVSVGQLSGDLGAMGIKVRGSGRASDWNINVIFNTKRLDELGKYRGEKMVKELSPRVLQCL